MNQFEPGTEVDRTKRRFLRLRLRLRFTYDKEGNEIELHGTTEGKLVLEILSPRKVGFEVVVIPAKAIIF